jgi:hypothetical protein
MSQLDKPSVISKLYNNRRCIVDTHNNNTVKPIQPSQQVKTYKTYKTVSEQLIRSDVVDGVKTNTYRSVVEVTHVYNNKGVISTTNHNNTFTYVV